MKKNTATVAVLLLAVILGAVYLVKENAFFSASFGANTKGLKDVQPTQVVELKRGEIV